MIKVFLGGSRRISKLNTDVRSRLDRIMEKNLIALVGDANGADKSIQAYLHEKNYVFVEIFCAGGKCRNNVGGWTVRSISHGHQRRDFDFYASKDRVMADEGSVGLMIWDGKSLGTLMNIRRLIRQEKKVAVYVSPDKKFIDLKRESDWDRFTAQYAPALRERVERQTAHEQRHPLQGQANLF